MGLIAVKPPAESKMRLGSILTGANKERLTLILFSHVLDCFVETFSAPQVLVVSRSAEMLALATQRGAVAVIESGNDQNAALSAGAQLALERGATRLVSASADLPFLTPDDLRQMLSATQARSVTIAPDRHRKGTNALAMSPPLAMPYLHGIDSYRLHCNAAKRAGLAVRSVERRGLSHDIDDPDDLRDFQAGSAGAQFVNFG